MKREQAIVTDHYSRVWYRQFSQPRLLRIVTRAFGVLTWPITVPMALVSRLSDFIFVTCSQALSLVPYLVGTIVRYEFYKWSLASCGTNVVIGFGTVLYYRDISVGNNVLIGMYNTVHYCDFGDYVLVADGCRLLSGPRYHHHGRTDLPMAMQGGELRRIRLGRDTWIGANAVVMADVREGAVVGAGSVVTSMVEPYSIVAGVPAIHKRYRHDTGESAVTHT